MGVIRGWKRLGQALYSLSEDPLGVLTLGHARRLGPTSVSLALAQFIPTKDTMDGNVLAPGLAARHA
jgi:hypothetical protein